jgi:archaeosine synthase
MELITHESMHRPEVLRWHRRLRERYSPPEGCLTVLLPCSARKPYASSRSHRLFREAIRKGAGERVRIVRELTLTSPLGLVPRELETLPPASVYDLPVTGRWSREEKEVVLHLLEDYRKRGRGRIIAHVGGAYREICEEAGIPVGEEKVLSPKGLRELEARVRAEVKELEDRGRDRRRETFQKIADFQFGKGSGEALFPAGAVVRGERGFLGRERIASLRGDGYLALARRGGELLAPLGRYTVTIDFQPEGRSLFAVGIREADPEIRPGDEVIVLREGAAVGVGKSLLNGEEMVRSEKGVAIALRQKI